jgi:hypothetical protein
VGLLEAVASTGLAAALPARFRLLNFHGLLVALVRWRGTTLHGPIAFATMVAVTIPIPVSIPVPVPVPISMAEAALVATERPIVAPAALEATLVARGLMMLRRRRMRRLEGFVQQILTLFVAEIIAEVTRLAQALTVAIGQLARLLQLLTVGHDDAVVMLCVL